jgi:hypothetical protein
MCYEHGDYAYVFWVIPFIFLGIIWVGDNLQLDAYRLGYINLCLFI